MNSKTLILLFLINFLMIVNAQNKSRPFLRTRPPRLEADPYLESQCPIFKYQEWLQPNLKARLLNGSYSFYIVNDLTLISNDDNYLTQKYYRYVEIYNKTNGSYVCDKIESTCLLFKFSRVIPFKDDCFSLNYYSPFYPNYTSLQPLLKSTLLEDYFEVVSNDQCILTFNTSGNCTKLPKTMYNYNLGKNIFDNYKMWHYNILNGFFVILGLFTNFISLLVFLDAGFRLPKMISVKYFILFAVSNIIFLITQWFMYSNKPSAVGLGIVFNYNKFFEIFYCKILTSLNLTVYYISEFIIVHVSFIRVLYVYLPIKIISFKSNYKFSFYLLNTFYFMLILVLTIINLIVSKAHDLNTAFFINEKSSYNEYCYESVDTYEPTPSISDKTISNSSIPIGIPLSRNISSFNSSIALSSNGSLNKANKTIPEKPVTVLDFEKWYQFSLTVLTMVLLTICSIAIILKLYKMNSSKRLNLKSERSKSGFWSRSGKSKTESMALSTQGDTKSTMADDDDNTVSRKDDDNKDEVSVSKSKSKKHAMHKTIFTLSISTIFFNIFYLVLLVYKMRMDDYLAKNMFRRSILVRELLNLLLLIRFSITGLLFFVSSETFRIHLIFIYKKFLNLFKCKK